MSQASRAERRIACVWLPNWPWQRLRRAQSQLTAAAVVLADESSRVPRVEACSEAATTLGVRPGMPLAEARSLASPARTRGTARSVVTPTTITPPPHSAGSATRRRPPSASPGPAWQFLAHDPAADRAELGELAIGCDRFSPAVALIDEPRPDGLLLDLTGCGAVFGGEAQLLAQLEDFFARRGFTFRLAVAETIGAAWALAHFGSADASGSHWVSLEPGTSGAALDRLPPAALRLPPQLCQTLGELGLSTIAAVRAMPRAGLATRLGTQLIERLDQAFGDKDELLAPLRTAQALEATWNFEEGLTTREPLEAALAVLLERLASELARRGQLARELECRLGGSRPMALRLGLCQPSRRVAYWQELLALQLEALALDRPIERLAVEITATVPQVDEQRWLLDDASDSADQGELARLLDRMSSRLGPDRVVHSQLVSDSQPEAAFRRVPVSSGSGSGRIAAGRPAGPKKSTAPAGKGRGASRRRQAELETPPPESEPRLRPIRLARRPRPLEVWSLAPDGPPQRIRSGNRQQALTAAWGPERIETGWWRGRTVARDYYQVETADGQRLWLFRRLSDGAWFLHGWFE